MIEKEPCELLLRAKSLAIQRGLDDSKVECPFIDICKGEKCYMFDPDEPEENEIIARSLKIKIPRSQQV
jgi:hypothetical protein